MARTRSPGYPTIGLREALEKVKLVFEKDYQNRIPRELVAQHMGYRSLNGKSLSILSAVSKFGLLEGRGNENCVSDLALEIIAHPSGAPERARAIIEAAARPELFGELDARFQDGKVSDAAIRSYLITRKFIPQAADIVVKSYRETKEFMFFEMEASGLEGRGVALHESFSIDQESSPDLVREPRSVSAGEREYLRGPLSRSATYRLLVSGEIGASEIDKIIRILTLQKEFLDEENEGS
jgi:hypothetical protein